MTAWISKAWQGWQNFTDDGKLAALFLAALLFLWFGNRKIRKEHRTLVLYATVAAVCCICPLTAAALMIYQTAFYDYQWIWSVVPLTVVTALAGTLFWSGIVEKYGKNTAGRWKCAGIAALLIAVLYLCGSMRKDVLQGDAEAAKSQKTAKVLEVLEKNGNNTDIMLWAPAEIMEYARALEGNIRLPYGRNMWDEALNGYSYDTYGEKEQILYAWMTYVEETGEGKAVFSLSKEDPQERTADGRECMKLAQELGVNCVLLPDNIGSGTLQEIESSLGVQAETQEGYYWFWIQE